MKYGEILQWQQFPISTKIIVANFYENGNQFYKISLALTSSIKNMLHKFSYPNVLYINIVDGKVIKWKVTTDNHQNQVLKQLLLDDFNFPKWQMGELHRPTASAAQFDEPPYSYLDQSGRLSGVDGKFLDEFCGKQKIKCKINNVKATPNVTVKELTLAIMSSDISLYKSFLSELPTQIDNIWLYEMEGLCLLVPRNIPVDPHTNVPFDYIVMTSLLLTIVTIAFVWKILNRRLTFVTIGFRIFEILIGRSMNYELMNLKEHLLTIPFIFMQIIMIGVYQSWIISIMIAKSSMRSISTLYELNESNTKIFQYFRESDVKINPKNLIKLLSLKNSTLTQTIPDNFDKNLAYLVSCQFAEYFVKSPANHQNQLKIFDKFPHQISISQLAYAVRENFPLHREFEFMVEALRESGIRKHWMKIANEELMKDKFEGSDEKDMVDLEAMAITFQILVFGALVGLIVLGIEIVMGKVGKFVTKRRELRQIKVLRANRQRILRKRRMLGGRYQARQNAIHSFVF